MMCLHNVKKADRDFALRLADDADAVGKPARYGYWTSVYPHVSWLVWKTKTRTNVRADYTPPTDEKE